MGDLGTGVWGVSYILCSIICVCGMDRIAVRMPRRAARQGLDKVKRLHDPGLNRRLSPDAAMTL